MSLHVCSNCGHGEAIFGAGGGDEMAREHGVALLGRLPLDAHVRNFLDCMASRQKPNASMEIGYHAALPALLALESLKSGKMLGWDAQKREPVVL